MTVVGKADVGERGTAVVDLLSALYPPPLAVQVGRRASEGDPRAVWSAVPSVTDPRLLLPAHGGLAAARSALRQLTGQRVRTRVARAGVALAAGTGTLGRLARLQISVAGPVDAPSIEDPLRELLGVAEVRLTLPVGPARSNRKPVLQVTDGSGRVLAFVKIGHNDLTGRLVRGEARTLAELASAAPPSVRVPRLLGLVHWDRCDVLLLEPLRIPIRRLTGEARRRRLLELVRDISVVGGRTTVPWGEHPLRTALLEQTQRCGEPGARLRAALGRLEVDQLLDTGAWHGDLNPGNLALVPGPCPVWDWERFGSGVPVGFDLLHHQLHEAITVRGLAPQLAARDLLARAAPLLSPLGVDPSVADTVARSYLVQLACRYLGDDQRAAGADLGRVESWLLPALEEGRS